MSTFTFAISCLTTSNLLWFMDVTFQVPIQYYSLQHWTFLISPVISTAGCCFCFDSIPSFFLVLFLHWSPVAYWAPTNLGSLIFQCRIFLPFHTVHGVLKARLLKWFAIPFSSGPHFVRTLHHDLSVLGAPTWPVLVSLSETRLWSMWSDWLVVCDCSFTLPALSCPLSVPTVLLGFLLPGTWVSPHSCLPWPCTWGISSRPLLLTLDVGYLLSASCRATQPPPLLQHCPAASVQEIPLLGWEDPLEKE